MTLQNITFCVRIFSPLQLYFSSLRAFFKIDNAVHYNYFWLIFLRLDGILGFLGQFFSSFLGKTGSGVFKWGVQLVKIALTSFDTFWRIAIEYLHKSFFFSWISMPPQFEVDAERWVWGVISVTTEEAVKCTTVRKITHRAILLHHMLI